MSLKGKPADSRKSNADIRMNLKETIKNEKEKAFTKCLEEAIRSEEVSRENFLIKQLNHASKRIPLTVEKLIGNNYSFTSESF